MLRKRYDENMTVEDGIKTALEIFKEILGKNFSLDRFDVGYIKTEEIKIKKLSGDTLKKYVK